jgi:hypothetical protein
LNIFAYAPNPVEWVDPFGLAAGSGGVYAFETKDGKAYIGKGPYERYRNGSVKERAGGVDVISRGVHMDTQSPCPKVSEAEYAEMVEHHAIVLYKTRGNSKPLLNTNASPGQKRTDPTTQKGRTNLSNCPGINMHAAKDAARLLGMLSSKKEGEGA